MADVAAERLVVDATEPNDHSAFQAAPLGLLGAACLGGLSVVSGATPVQAGVVAAASSAATVLSAVLANGARLEVAHETTRAPGTTSALSLSVVGAAALALGSVLKTNTHHRGLGAVTFALLIGIGATACVLSARRIAVWAENTALAGVLRYASMALLALVVLVALGLSSPLHGPASELLAMTLSLAAGWMFSPKGKSWRTIGIAVTVLSVGVAIAAAKFGQQREFLQHNTVITQLLLGVFSLFFSLRFSSVFVRSPRLCSVSLGPCTSDLQHAAVGNCVVAKRDLFVGFFFFE